MGFWKWLQKIGSTGSIARYVVKQYKAAKEANPDRTDYDIVGLIFNNRYDSVSPKPNEKSRYQTIKKNGEESGYYSVITTGYEFREESETFIKLYTLCMGIIYIEMGVNPTNPNDAEVYQSCSEVISEELKRKGIE